MTGMVGASNDVVAREFEATQERLDSIPEPMIERVLERAAWIIDVINSEEWGGVVDVTAPVGEGEAMCPECGEPCQAITLQEILVKFYLAMKLEEQDEQLVR